MSPENLKQESFFQSPGLPSSCERWLRLETFRREETLGSQNEKIQFAKETLGPDKMHLSQGRLGW